MAIADIIKRNSPASSGTCRQTSPQKTHRSHLKEVEVALPLTAEPTPSSWAALEARSRNCVRAALDSGTAGCGALGEVVAGPCAEVVGRCWEAEEVVAPVVVLVGVGRGLEGATQCGWEAEAGDQTPTSRCAPSGRPEQKTNEWCAETCQTRLGLDCRQVMPIVRLLLHRVGYV